MNDQMLNLLKIELDVFKAFNLILLIYVMYWLTPVVVWSPPHQIWIWCRQRAGVALLIAWW